jgi:hypothetical protein
MANKGRMPIILAVNTPVNWFGFFEISGIVINSANEKFASKRHLMHFFVIER